MPLDTASGFFVQSRNPVLKWSGTIMGRSLYLGTALAALLALSGCGQEIKKENESLKARLSDLGGEKAAIQAEVDYLQKELEETRSRVTALTAELDARKMEIEVLRSRPAPKKARR